MKIFKYLFAILTFTFASCEGDYLDVVPDNLATIDLAFSNEFNARKYLYTCYSYLPQTSNPDQNPGMSAGDEVWFPEALDNRQGAIIKKGFQSATNPMFDYWRNDLYTAIRTCNIFLENIASVPGLDQYLITQWTAEAKFLKAFYHFYLLQMYGPIIINDEAVEVTESTDGLKLERNTLDEGFQYVLGLLDEAIADLPLLLQFEDEDRGRATKPIAAAIKARVAITYASPLFNGNTVYTNFSNADGTPLFPQSYDESKWQIAAEAAREAIEICTSAGISLIQKEDYVDPFVQTDTTLLKAALRMRVTAQWGKEIIWATTENTNSIQYEAMPRLYGYTTNPVGSRHAPTMRVVENYYTENGVPIDEDTSYDYENRFRIRTIENEDRYNLEPGQQTAVINFDREPRFYADLAFDRSAWFGNGRELDTDPWYIHSRRGEFASIFEISQYSVTGYWPKKLLNIETTVRNGNSLNTDRYAFPVIRLADLYLYLAEALNEVKASPDNEVYENINIIRERAGLNGVIESWANFSNNPSKPTTKSGMRDIIQQERMIEKAFEGDRFWDLRRWKLAEEYMSRPIRGWTVTESAIDDYYNVSIIFSPRFTQKDYLWPIAEGEILNNPSLVQNPGW